MSWLSDAWERAKSTFIGSPWDAAKDLATGMLTFDVAGTTFKGIGHPGEEQLGGDAPIYGRAARELSTLPGPKNATRRFFNEFSIGEGIEGIRDDFQEQETFFGVNEKIFGDQSTTWLNETILPIVGWLLAEYFVPGWGAAGSGIGRGLGGWLEEESNDMVATNAAYSALLGYSATEGIGADSSVADLLINAGGTGYNAYEQDQKKREAERLQNLAAGFEQVGRMNPVRSVQGVKQPGVSGLSKGFSGGESDLLKQLKLENITENDLFKLLASNLMREDFQQNVPENYEIF